MYSETHDNIGPVDSIDYSCGSRFPPVSITQLYTLRGRTTDSRAALAIVDPKVDFKNDAAFGLIGEEDGKSMKGGFCRGTPAS